MSNERPNNWLLARVSPKNRHFTMGRKDQKSPRSHTWKIIPVRKWLVTPIYEPFGPLGRGNNLIILIDHAACLSTKCKRSEANLDQGSLSPIFVEYPSSQAWQEGACILMFGLRVSLAILFLTSGCIESLMK